MGRLTEEFAKELLREVGIRTPVGSVATSAAEAAEAARDLGRPVVVKALVPAGKRGKAGAIRFARTPDEAGGHAEQLLGSSVRGFVVDRVLVEEQLSIEQELFVGLSFDFVERTPVLLVSTQGGVDVEELSQGSPGAIVRLPFDAERGLPAYMARQAWEDAGLWGKVLVKVAEITATLYRIFDRNDARLVEVNPLCVVTSGDLVAAAALVNVDDQALFRHPELCGKIYPGLDRNWRALNERELAIMDADQRIGGGSSVRYTEMDGDIGFAVTGGGASLTAADTIIRAGGRPANYCDMGPGSGYNDKFRALLRTILSRPGLRGLVVGANIWSAGTVAPFARILLDVLDEAGVDPMRFPVVVRFGGRGEEEYLRELRQRPGLHCFGSDTTIEEAGVKIVELVEARSAEVPR